MPYALPRGEQFADWERFPAKRLEDISTFCTFRLLLDSLPAINFLSPADNPNLLRVKEGMQRFSSGC